jgi:hypothetical protein
VRTRTAPLLNLSKRRSFVRPPDLRLFACACPLEVCAIPLPPRGILPGKGVPYTYPVHTHAYVRIRTRVCMYMISLTRPDVIMASGLHQSYTIRMQYIAYVFTQYTHSHACMQLFTNRGAEYRSRPRLYCGLYLLGKPVWTTRLFLLLVYATKD